MQQYIISTSSTCDLPQDYLEKHRIPFIRYTFTMDNKIYEDDCCEKNRQKIFQSMRQGTQIKTSMINQYNYYEFFKSIMQKGKDVIFLDMSQKMSISFMNATIAANDIQKEFPNQQLYIMDTRCISGGLGLLVTNMVRNMEKGMTYENNIRWGESHKLKIAHRFTVDNLKYLKEGGRCSTPAALIGSMLSVKPILYVPDQGTLNISKKIRGRKNSLDAIYESIHNDLSEIDTQNMEIHILHADCQIDAEYIRDCIKKDFPNVSEITITSLGVIIGAHCGPGLITIFYFCNERRP